MRRDIRSLLVVTSLMAAGCGSSGTSPGSTIPTAPNVTLAVGDTQVTLTWPTVTGATTYTIYWSTTSGVTPATGTPITAATSGFVHNNLINGRTYYYTVTAANGLGESSGATEQLASPGSAYDPSWGSATPDNVVSYDYNSGLTTQQNGEALRVAIQNLVPGERLDIGAGTYTMLNKIDMTQLGTPTQPVWVSAKLGESVVITHPTTSENVLNLGDASAARCIAIQGIEFTGGNAGIALGDAEDIWIESCHIHNTASAGILGETDNTPLLFITRNTIHDLGGTGEAIKLGTTGGGFVTHSSTIARNTIYDCAGTEGEGIELQQGSYNTTIVENTIRDCLGPCLLVYGTAGNTNNLIERNTLYNSGSHVLRLQGEAVVRNNLLMNGATTGFYSNSDQATSASITFVHNTIVNTARATDLVSWNGATGMTFANNVVYSQAESIYFPGGSTGVTVLGNITLGTVTGAASGFTAGVDLSDFVDVTWTATNRDGTPASGGSIENTGDPIWAVTHDISGETRSMPLDSGSFDG